MKHLFNTLLQLLSFVSRKKVIYVSQDHVEPSRMAVKSLYGFWYVGNVYDSADIAYGIAQKGTVEPWETATVIDLLKTLRHDFVFFDIGANTGWYSMVAASVSESSIVHSFEPLSEHTECLAEAATINNYTSRIHVHKIALSNISGKADIVLAGSGSSLNPHFVGHRKKTRSVPIETLDTYLRTNTLPFPDFVKIDAEGHEYEILMGAQETMRHHPIFFIEIAHNLKNLKRDFVNTHFNSTLELLEKAGYRAFVLDNEQLRKVDAAQTESGVAMYLFLHHSKHHALLSRYA